ncbi:hypothetical protein MRB53_002934 [Persea americana]|uniref:Uncharacterized protein n=1 Tax=Persea americana TaxID=3435 RepID=A0ACC2MWZ1_PERAE|nr:hypothetical protein MRB53_002934 [Persea americana]|eukprot:TRINITY_DN3244_c0_g1_i1.p1 TRINITY_DN3244_c0_g1~~TRINITY_DN3244_c0_g1_i1.p1  ORF type:complete len:260 (+),score=44.50 TRINITY_DN3244_c0_g1_i1:121-900(+)
MASTREIRRKRIVDRGSDRLAFITGQTDSLPPQQDFPQTPSLPATTNNVATTHERDDAAGIVLPKSETSNEAASSFLDTQGSVKPSICSSVQASSNPVVSSSIQTSSNPVVSDEPRVIPRPNNQRLIFTSDQIISAISASENIRLICSAIIALLAVISYSINPLGRSFITSMIVSRPIYLVLVTNVTIVLGLLMANKGGSNKAEVEARKAAAKTDDWADNVGKALEVGLVLQKALSAVSMDFSICAVLLISGLSLRGLC